MQRWAPYPADRPRQRDTGTIEAQLHASAPNQPADPPASRPEVINADQTTSPNHVYYPVNASGNAFVHQGNNYYHISQPEVNFKEQLLTSLHFREMLKRYDNIEDPHSDTFRWIFEPPDNGQPRWDSFQDWLNGDGGLYWVSGKPGSGKSVLMKHLASNFQQSLRSDNCAVVSLSFWFWEAAHTNLERNTLGCLRSLLWQVLQLPEYCESIVKETKNNLPFEWTKRRLRDAFNIVLRILLDANVKILIFLDGLDECGSDTTEVMNFAIGIAKTFPKVKICVSSRPEPILLLSLGSYSHLRMQDLNEPDVLAIIQQDLFENPQFASLLNEEQELDRLRSQLIWEAKGVLLWIRLVTKNLVQAVAEGDTFAELQIRLDKLPTELEGENGLYAYMLRRNASSSKAYLAEAALFCQIACRDVSSTILEYSLATSDNLRNTYLQFKNGWETLHHQLDCDRLTRAINARTGGLLEVEKLPETGSWYTLCLRAARTRDPALTKLLSCYRSHKVSFIHRTARSYILETVSGQKLLASSQRSSLEIETLVLEAWLISFVMLPCLESVAPVGSDILTDIYVYHAKFLKTQKEFQKLESVVNSLATKDYLWLESYRTRSMSLTAISSLRGTTPFMTTREGRVSFTPILPTFGASCTADEFQQADLWLDAAHLLCISFHKIVGHSHNIFAQKSHQEKCFDLLLSHQPDTNYCLTNDFGEQISGFHHMLVAYSRITPNDFFDVVPAFEGWLLQANTETKSRKCEPTMIECNSLFFQDLGGPSSSEDLEDACFILGIFGLKDYCNILHDLRLSEYFKPHDVQNPAQPDSADIRILCMRPSEAWKPEMYILSIGDFEEVFEEMSSCETSNLYSVGILRLSVRIHGVARWFWAMRSRLTKIRSLIDVFQYLGKSEAQIASFIALEEPRIQQTYDEVIYGHWREWLYGTEDQCPEQYRGIPRPQWLYFRVKEEDDL